jgi:pantoate kinase
VSTSAVGGSIGTNSVNYDALSTSSTESENVSRRVAKGWVNFNGNATLAIRSSFGVVEVVRNNTGEYTVNFNTSIGTGMGWSASGSVSTNYNYTINSHVTSASSIKVQTQTAAPTKTDLDYISVVVFGL